MTAQIVPVAPRPSRRAASVSQTRGRLQTPARRTPALEPAEAPTLSTSDNTRMALELALYLCVIAAGLTLIPT